MVAPQYITLGFCTAVPATHWEITLLLWWKWLPCRKKIKAVDRWMVTSWSLIIREMALVTLHLPQSDTAATAVGQNNLFCYWSRRLLLRFGNFYTIAAPSELSVFPHKKGSERGHRFVLRHILFSVHSLQVLSRDRSSLLCSWLLTSRKKWKLSSQHSGWSA